MTNKLSIETSDTHGLHEWSLAIKEQLGFAKAKVSVPRGYDAELFEGRMFIDESNQGVLKAIVNSSALTVSLKYGDFNTHKSNKFFLINTYDGGMIIKNENHRKVINSGDGIIIPSSDEFIEMNFTKRNSVSIIMDASNLTDDENYAREIFSWMSISELEYSHELKKLLFNYHLNYSESFCSKNTDALVSILALELETHKNEFKNIKRNYKNRSAHVVDYIRKNVKNNKLRLSDVAIYFGMTERSIQYILSEAGDGFCDILAFERCKLLAHKICNNPNSNLIADIYDSGFNSLSTAYRQFKKFYNLTPKQYSDIKKKSLQNN
ncbi:helix-turn-helix domain-containing protein [Escherichia coli]